MREKCTKKLTDINQQNTKLEGMTTKIKMKVCSIFRESVGCTSCALVYEEWSNRWKMYRTANSIYVPCVSGLSVTVLLK